MCYHIGCRHLACSCICLHAFCLLADTVHTFKSLSRLIRHNCDIFSDTLNVLSNINNGCGYFLHAGCQLFHRRRCACDLIARCTDSVVNARRCMFEFSGTFFYLLDQISQYIYKLVESPDHLSDLIIASDLQMCSKITTSPIDLSDHLHEISGCCAHWFHNADQNNKNSSYSNKNRYRSHSNAHLGNRLISSMCLCCCRIHLIHTLLLDSGNISIHLFHADADHIDFDGNFSSLSIVVFFHGIVHTFQNVVHTIIDFLHNLLLSVTLCGIIHLLYKISHSLPVRCIIISGFCMACLTFCCRKITIEILLHCFKTILYVVSILQIRHFAVCDIFD